MILTRLTSRSQYTHLKQTHPVWMSYTDALPHRVVLWINLAPFSVTVFMCMGGHGLYRHKTNLAFSEKRCRETNSHMELSIRCLYNVLYYMKLSIPCLYNVLYYMELSIPCLYNVLYYMELRDNIFTFVQH